jgi:flagellar hook-associated protein 3 FlgL
MTIDGVGLRTSFLGTRIMNLQSQFDDLQAQLTTGKKSDTYAGMGANRGFAVALRAQISSIDSFADTATNVNTRITIASTALQRIAAIGTQVQGAASTSSTQVGSNGQTVGQATARSSLDEMLQLLNTQAGDRYLFSGRATDTPATASMDDILNGVGGKAGLKQLIAERNQADLGPSPAMGRLVLSTPSPTSISIAEDVAGSPFGLKLNAVSSTSPGVTLTQPTGSPAAETVDLGATNPSSGDTLTFTFNLPDGTTENIQLTATTTTPVLAGQFLIGANSTATAANLNSALTTAVGALANGPLVAASAMKASSEFFSGNPPPRVAGPPFATATSQVPGTAANTLSWYTGETGTDPARGTALARVDQGISVQYGARANEEAFTAQLQTIAALAAVSTSATDPNATAQVSALYQRVAAKLLPQPGQQSVQDIQADFASAQSLMQSATDRQTQVKNTAQSMLQSIEGVSDAEVSAKILAVQNSLNASYMTTSMLYQTTLLKFL